MPKKEKQQPPEPGPELPQKPIKKKDDGVLLPILYALLASVGLSILVMAIGIGVTASSNAAQAEAQTTPRGTLPATPYIAPTTPPKSTPTTEPDGPDETQEAEQEPPATATQTPTPTQAPTQTQAPTPTRTPTAPQTNPPAVQPTANVTPVAPTAAPTQPPAGNPSSGARDFSGGRVLATTQSNNGNDPVYHTKNCTSAQRIPSSSELWYDSAQAAEAAGRRLCGNCARQ